MQEWVSQAEFGRRVGVSHAAVSSAINTGRINCDPSTKKINWATEEKRWKDSRRIDKDTFDPYGKRKDRDEPARMGTDADSYNEAKRQEAIYKAKLKKLEYEERERILIPRETVRDAVYKYGKQIRDAVITIPERVAAVFASEIFEIVLRDLGSDVAGKLDPKEFEQIARRAWARESRAVLEAIEKKAV